MAKKNKREQSLPPFFHETVLTIFFQGGQKVDSAAKQRKRGILRSSLQVKMLTFLLALMKSYSPCRLLQRATQTQRNNNTDNENN